MGFFYDQLRLFPIAPSDPLGGFRIAWIFRRENAELRVAQSEDQRRLIVTQAGSSRERRFETSAALIAFQTELEQHLRREGWALARVEPERRSGRDRRGQPRNFPDRRHLS